MTHDIHSRGRGVYLLLLKYAALIDPPLRNVDQYNLGSVIEQKVQSILTNLSFSDKHLFVAFHSI